MLVATLAIAGIPPFSGFFSKDEILAAAFARGADQPVFYLFYGMGLLAALLTAFYMARLMAMTFLGENRTGEQEREHLHEAPWIMTGPLVVLGVLSLRAACSTCRTCVGGHAALEHWLEPVIGAARSACGRWSCRTASTEYLLVGAAVAIGVLGLFLGFRATLARPIPPARQAPADTRPGAGPQPQVLRGRAVRRDHRPAGGLALAGGALEGYRPGVVDGVGVNGTAWVSRVAGGGLRLLQTGQVGIYVVLFLVGAIWILRAVIR